MTIYRRLSIIDPKVTTDEFILGSNERTKKGTLVNDNYDGY